jgi:hypothetical protein
MARKNCEADLFSGITADLTIDYLQVLMYIIAGEFILLTLWNDFMVCRELKMSPVSGTATNSMTDWKRCGDPEWS